MKYIIKKFSNNTSIQKKQLLKKKQIRIKKEKLDTLKSVILMKYITHKKKLEKELDEIYDKKSK